MLGSAARPAPWFVLLGKSSGFANRRLNRPLPSSFPLIRVFMHIRAAFAGVC
jgi:hypothetical protein